MGLLDFLSNYYHLEMTQIRNLIVWICSNLTASNKAQCLSLIKSPLFAMIIESIPKESKTKVMKEILFLLMNILSFCDSEISFSFVNYNLMQNLIDLYYANAENWNTLLHVFIINVFKNIFKVENKYRLEEEKNHNFDDNNLHFIEYFLRQGCLDFLLSLRINKAESVNKTIDELEFEINKRFNNCV